MRGKPANNDSVTNIQFLAKMKTSTFYFLDQRREAGEEVGTDQQ